jgi:hypothetical protein
LATGSKDVSPAAITFHELAEAFIKIEFMVQYQQRDGSAGAHVWAGSWEQSVINQRKDFTVFPGGGKLQRRY